ncbi:CapA family protein [Jeotgalibacillus soli]|uniref:Capsule synthesis protein CapA domain-containing protein n=1 Tax=Jeotgalibacillus soli TaxID=889306 RepID=A0A0C2W0Z6_9BACL|nr:CapA family protein [Jeotgalibacillus soli]KIL49828.1 hypothetical protein KP78_12960 [Jeotgalibacillus soli]
MNKVRFILFFLFMAIGLAGCNLKESQMLFEDKEAFSRQTGGEVKSAFSERMEMTTTITIGAIGDVLLHDAVYQYAATDTGFNFKPAFESVMPLLSSPDFMMANQESNPGGIELGLSSYPAFNSPHEIVTDLQYSGVDMVTAANNHIMDRGIDSAMAAMDFYDEIGMPYVGVYRDVEDRQNHRVKEINGIKLGVLAYTFSTNGIPIPFGFEESVALLEPERMVSEIRVLRDNVDVVVVHLHWGNEYEQLPNQSQVELAERLSEEGVDIIFGHHPHVLQPIDEIERSDGGKTVVFYSLGNFYSGQNFPYTDIGGVATINIKKVTRGSRSEVSLSQPAIEPTQVIRGSQREYLIVPMKDSPASAIEGVSYEETIEHINQNMTP